MTAVVPGRVPTTRPRMRLHSGIPDAGLASGDVEPEMNRCKSDFRYARSACLNPDPVSAGRSGTSLGGMGGSSAIEAPGGVLKRFKASLPSSSVDRVHHDIAGFGGVVALDRAMSPSRMPSSNMESPDALRARKFPLPEHVRRHAKGVPAGLREPSYRRSRRRSFPSRGTSDRRLPSSSYLAAEE